MPQKHEFTAVFRKVPEGYLGFVEELPGANTQGATLNETRRNLHEAIDLVLEAKERGWPRKAWPVKPKGIAERAAKARRKREVLGAEKLFGFVTSMHASLAKSQRCAFDAFVGWTRNFASRQLCNGISLVKHQIKRSEVDNFQYNVARPGRVDSSRS